MRSLARPRAARAAPLLAALLCACASAPEPDPAPPALELRVRHLLGRSSVELGCGTPLEPELRRDDRSLRLALPGCGPPADVRALAAVAAGSPLLEAVAVEPGVEPREAGVEAVLTAAGGPSEVEASARAAARSGFAAVDLAPPGDAAPREARIETALAAVEREEIRGCALVFESLLRNQLGDEPLAAALRPDGGPQQALLRPALRRLGALSPVGALWLPGPVSLRADRPEDVEAAEARAAEVKGLLALLRATLAGLEPPASRDAALHALFAPDLDGEAFAVVLQRARDGEAICGRY